jgi:hypothetical protein
MAHFYALPKYLSEDLECSLLRMGFSLKAGIEKKFWREACISERGIVPYTYSGRAIVPHPLSAYLNLQSLLVN